MAFVSFAGILILAPSAAAADRFVKNGNGTVTDTQTKLMWAAQASPSAMNWLETKIYCQGFSAGGYTGWRLPTKEEPGALHQGGGKNFISVGWDAWSISESSYSYAFVYFFSYGAWAPRERGAFVQERNGKSAASIMGASSGRC